MLKMTLSFSLLLQPLTLLDPGVGAQSARIQFKGSKLLFDLETLCMLSEI